MIEITEHHHQKFIFEWANLQKNIYPELAYMFAVPNGGYRHIQVANKLKAEGVKSGVPDIFLDAAKGKYHGLRIELKNKKNGKKTGIISESQRKYLDYYHEQGYYAPVCWGSEDAIKAIEWYLKQC